MKFLEWKNKNIGDFDVFGIAGKEEMDMIVSYFGTDEAESVTFRDMNEYYYFINSKDKTITPMPMLSLAFGGMYNGYPPYGDEINYVDFDIKEYKLVLYNSIKKC